MSKIKEQIKEVAKKYSLQIIYAFGSRRKEVLDMVKGKIEYLSSSSADLDIGIKAGRHLRVEEKVKIALIFEDIFNVAKVDIVIVSEVPIFLALEIVKGELLYAENLTHEAEYQLYIMRRAAEIIPYERMKQKMTLGV